METIINVKALKVINLFNPTTVYIDPDIQRPQGNWDKDPDLRYSALRAYNRNRMTSPIVLADARECLDYVEKEHPDDIKSKTYYSKCLANGTRYIVLDGQHRLLDVLNKFFDNDWQYTGELTDADEEVVFVENKFYNELPTRVKDALNGCTVPIRVFKDLQEKELSALFIDHNKGVPLNAQQKRRAKRTPLTPWVRELALSNKAAMNLLGKAATNTCDNEELIAKLLLSTVRTWNSGSSRKSKVKFEKATLNTSTLDSLYESGVPAVTIFDVNGPYVHAEFSRFQDIFEKFAQILTAWDARNPFSGFRSKGGDIKPSRRLKGAPTWCLWWAAELIVDDGYSVDDVSLTFESVRETLELLIAKSHVRQGKDLDKQFGDNKVVANNRYFWWQVSAPTVPDARNAARKTFVKALKRSAKFNRGCSIVQIPTAEQLALQLASTEEPVVQEIL